jgi:translation initiation factor eIF-2B subunit delta
MVSSETADKLEGLAATEAPVAASNAKASQPFINGENSGQSSATPQNDAPDSSAAAVVGAEGKLSNAELKQRAKAEKAAKRAQQKQDKAPDGPVSQTPKKDTGSADTTRKGSIAGALANTQTKGQHKRAGSGLKALPLRPVQPAAVPSVVQPKKDSKNVALFGHLYGQPRRTTIAAAGKDVHPAILALGLQMSNYVVCGSNARCVATLLSLKRVRNLIAITCGHY